MKRGHDGLEGGYFRLGMLVNRHASAVVCNAYLVVGKKSDLNVRGMPAHRFVARVVEHLPDEVMEAVGTGRSDVHARALTDRLETLKNGDSGGVVGFILSNSRGACGAAVFHLLFVLFSHAIARFSVHTVYHDSIQRGVKMHRKMVDSS